MFYTGKVIWYDEVDGKEVEHGFFLEADNYSEAAAKLRIYFGETEMIKISVETFSNDTILTTNNIKLYDCIKEEFAANICW